MSGGSFCYAYAAVLDIADRIGEEGDCRQEWERELRGAMADLLRAMEGPLHDLEWWKSSDSTEGEFIRECAGSVSAFAVALERLRKGVALLDVCTAVGCRNGLLATPVGGCLWCPRCGGSGFIVRATGGPAGLIGDGGEEPEPKALTPGPSPWGEGSERVGGDVSEQEALWTMALGPMGERDITGPDGDHLTVWSPGDAEALMMALRGWLDAWKREHPGVPTVRGGPLVEHYIRACCDWTWHTVRTSATTEEGTEATTFCGLSGKYCVDHDAAEGMSWAESTAMRPERAFEALRRTTGEAAEFCLACFEAQERELSIGGEAEATENGGEQ